jgi:ubiquinone/menaquinone biosynthesis C-methylase UbiE
MRNLYYWKKVTGDKKITKHKYFIDQIKKPKFSTVELFNFLQKKIKVKNKSFIDVGCGNGCNLDYLVTKYGIDKNCLGLDLNPYLIKFANDYLAKKNLKFDTSNIFKIKKKYISKFDVALCLQTLPYLEDYQRALKEISKLKTDYIVSSCLLWEGLIDFNIKINVFKNSSHKRLLDYYRFYNIYSLKNFINYMKTIGFKKNYVKKFIVKHPIYSKNKKVMGTYTIKNQNKFMQMSGPIKMNWYFIFSKRN